MAELRLKQYMASVRVSLAEDIILRHTPTSPSVIGHELATQIHQYVKQHQLGYYPALDFFSQGAAGQGPDPDLIDAVESVSWLLCRLVRQEFQSKLRQVFSSVKFQAVQTIAYTMPGVRYNTTNALHNLALHYTPLSVKLDVELSVLNRKQGDEGFESFIRSALGRWLRDSFESIEVSSVVSLSE